MNLVEELQVLNETQPSHWHRAYGFQSLRSNRAV
jgi:hypothetical protein